MGVACCQAPSNQDPQVRGGPAALEAEKQAKAVSSPTYSEQGDFATVEQKKSADLTCNQLELAPYVSFEIAPPEKRGKKEVIVENAQNETE